MPSLSIDAGLNLIWAVLSLGVLLCWNAEWNSGGRRALVAILCVLVLLFPAISAADDVSEQALTYDAASSSLSGSNGKEIKQLVAPVPAAALPARGLILRLYEASGDGLQSSPASSHLSSLLLASSSGIHSPPQF